MRRWAALGAIAAMLAAAGCAPHPTRPADPVAEALALMTGTFDSRAQAAADARYLPVTLTMTPIWPDRADARWLYVEQAMVDAPGKPYRQRVYRLRSDGQGGVASEVFLIQDPARFVRGWETGALAQLDEADLSPRPGCTVYLAWEPGGFRGATRGQGCESHLRGARWASAEVALFQGGLHSWDRGFDAEGRQAWGATAGPYHFLRTR
ncbi:chromophore lyase CpcT/CpeT [Arenimonas sp. MALMAid1274]|uniref:chromophore lyase CpcT/CpeT n=1 Tax=Arenimonas sp. MALMAid1274 TaxID=3411630 RepID=UPI003B9E6599